MGVDFSTPRIYRGMKMDEEDTRTSCGLLEEE